MNLQKENGKSEASAAQINTSAVGGGVPLLGAMDRSLLSQFQFFHS